MTEEELRVKAAGLSACGKTYSDIAAAFEADGVPGEWTKSTIQHLMSSAPRETMDAVRRAHVDADDQRAAEKARRRFLNTPQGQARTAFESGAHVFQVDFDVRNTQANTVAMVGAFTATQTNDVTAVLNQICEEGWELLTASMVFHETGSVSRDKFLASGQQIAVQGRSLATTSSSAVKQTALNHQRQHELSCWAGVRAPKARVSTPTEFVWQQLWLHRIACSRAVRLCRAPGPIPNNRESVAGGNPGGIWRVHAG